ncbi:hypothetical protein [Rhizobium hidalgonense]|uniref:hypothetical protein n=1 Tax=Rhizobium hidalgonense TaxID=1538159 RepID=UPI0028720BC0|nr:hypothetical protein [Rhizobium hidalgonense]MDR9813072.1 hypothetical protein [Rhizobium hidalgonense]
MSDQEAWDELHAEQFEKVAADCDRMAKEWAAKHCIEGYQMAAQILIQKEVYRRMAYSMRQPRYVREERERFEAEESNGQSN